MLILLNDIEICRNRETQKVRKRKIEWEAARKIFVNRVNERARMNEEGDQSNA